MPLTVPAHSVSGHLARWLEEGKIKAIVDIVDGLDQAPRALIDLFEGRNKGKMAVRV